jgi:hypothetical protein
MKVDHGDENEEPHCTPVYGQEIFARKGATGDT